MRPLRTQSVAAATLFCLVVAALSGFSASAATVAENVSAARQEQQWKKTNAPTTTTTQQTLATPTLLVDASALAQQQPRVAHEQRQPQFVLANLEDVPGPPEITDSGTRFVDVGDAVESNDVVERQVQQESLPSRNADALFSSAAAAELLSAGANAAAMEPQSSLAGGASSAVSPSLVVPQQRAQQPLSSEEPLVMIMSAADQLQPQQQQKQKAAATAAADEQAAASAAAADLIASTIAQALASSTTAAAAPSPFSSAPYRAANDRPPLLAKPGSPACEPGPVPAPAPRSSDPRWVAASRALTSEVKAATANWTSSSTVAPVDLLLVGDGVFETLRETKLGQPWSYAKGSKQVFEKYYGRQQAKRKAEVLAISGDQVMNVAWRLSSSASGGGKQLAPWVGTPPSTLPPLPSSAAATAARSSPPPPAAIVVQVGIEDLIAACGSADGRWPGDEASIDLSFPYLEDTAWTTVDRLTAMLDGIRRALPDTHVVVSALLPRGGKENAAKSFDWPNQLSRNIDIVNSQLRGWCEDSRIDDKIHSTFVDCGWSLMDPTMSRLDPAALPDGVRPGAVGMERLAACLEPAVGTAIATGRARIAEREAAETAKAAVAAIGDSRRADAAADAAEDAADDVAGLVDAADAVALEEREKAEDAVAEATEMLSSTSSSVPAADVASSSSSLLSKAQGHATRSRIAQAIADAAARDEEEASAAADEASEVADEVAERTEGAVTRAVGAMKRASFDAAAAVVSSSQTKQQQQLVLVPLADQQQQQAYQLVSVLAGRR